LARASRHYLPSYIWHITHRCHKREFLLKFARDQRRWLGWVFEAKLRKGDGRREPRWTESIAVGSETFIEDTKERLGVKAMGRQVVGGDGNYELRDSGSSYKPDFGHENVGLSPKNTYFWDLSD